MSTSRDTRREELAESLAALRGRIADACAAAGRDPAEVRLLAVTKTFPATDVATLLALGLTDFGENRDAEATAKVAEVAALRPAAAPRWHMVGRLQRNKARSVVGWASEVQSVDSARLADALAAAVRKRDDAGPLDVLVQASIDGDPERGGCPLPGLPALADRIAATPELRLRGVMAVAPLTMAPEVAFGQLADAAARLKEQHPDATELSAGMSGDLAEAIRCGSTCVRVGTGLLGGRRLASA